MHVALLILTSWLLLWGPSSDDDEKRERTLSAHPISETITIDGRLSEADWAGAPAAHEFRQYEPDEGAEPSQRTEVRVLYGDNALYVGAHLYDDAPDKIMATLGRRDELNQADWFFVSIDAYLDRKTAYTFGVNAAGVLLDGVVTRELDRSWDAVWDGAARITADGWIVEIRIPYSMLRFSEADVQTWGVNFQRVIPRNGETAEWALVRRTERSSGVVAHYGRLTGLNNLRPRRNIQVTPYTVSRLLSAQGKNPDDRIIEREIDFGGDLKIGISSNTVLDVTFNPDFGQVDADPAQLNLTAFETFFSERRPFFTEGAQVFNFSYGREGNLLYSRRIGGGDPIIGAAKLTGRTEKGLSVGVLGAATGENFDPTRFYAATRVRQQIGRISTVGGMLTTHERTAAAGSRRRSFAGGLDWDLRMHRNTYKFDGQVSFSHIRIPGSDLDPVTGYAASAGFDRVRGVWTYNFGLELFDDRFNPNDLGRLRRGNFVRMSAGMGHQINGNRPFGPFRRASLRLFSWQKWVYDTRDNQGAGFFLSTSWQMRGFQSIEFRIFGDYLFGGVDPFETRGLGPWKRPRQINFNTVFRTDSRRSWQLTPSGRVTLYDHAGIDYSTGLKSRWNAGSRLRLSAEVNLSKGVNRTAWAANESFARHPDKGWGIGAERGSPASLDNNEYEFFTGLDALDPVFSGLTPYEGFKDRFYFPVFGRRDTRTVDFSLRSTITFTPNLSLQVYGQLFVAKGRYDDFSLLTTPETLVPIDNYPKRYDFSISSLQSNVVLRWEYRSGSTLFFVWSQSRRSNATINPFDLTGRSPFDADVFSQFSETFDLFPTNVFLVKLNYKFLR
ncbi:DUF5916 domain-containing protein [Rhodocaloribacter sp.]